MGPESLLVSNGGPSSDVLERRTGGLGPKTGQRPFEKSNGMEGATNPSLADPNNVLNGQDLTWSAGKCDDASKEKGIGELISQTTSDDYSFD